MTLIFVNNQLSRLETVKSREVRFSLVRLCVIFLFCLTGFESTLAQNSDILKRLTVTPSSDQGRTTVFLDYPDKAGIMIQSSLTNLSFESNMDGIVNERHQPDQGQYVLVIEPVAQIITINAQGYMQERLRISGISAKDVRYYVVEPEAEVEGAIIPVIFQVTPADAEVFVYGLGVDGLQLDGQQVDISQPVPMEEREYRVVFGKTGYRTVERDVLISPANNLVQQTLEEIEPVVVTIQTNPEASTVVLNGVEAGVSDASGRLGLFRMPGEYELTIRKSGYVTQTQEVTISETGSNQFEIDLVRNVGILRLQVEPSDAEVRIDKEVRQRRGLIELSPGVYRLEASREGYAPYSETLEIARGETKELKIKLEGYKGILQLTTEPFDTRWNLLDASGKIVRSGEGMERISDLIVGSYVLQVAADGYQNEDKGITIRRDETSEIQVALREEVQLSKVPKRTPQGSVIFKPYLFIGGIAGQIKDLELVRSFDFTIRNSDNIEQELTSDFLINIETPPFGAYLPYIGVGGTAFTYLDFSVSYGLYNISVRNKSGLFSTGFNPHVRMHHVDFKSSFIPFPNIHPYRLRFGISLNKGWLTNYENFAPPIDTTIIPEYQDSQKRIEGDINYSFNNFDFIAGLSYALFGDVMLTVELRGPISSDTRFFYTNASVALPIKR